MQFQRLGDRYIIRLQSGEPVMETLTSFMHEQGAGSAGINAIGAVRWAELAYWNAETKEYEFRRFDEQMEVVGLVGNLSIKDAKPFLHIHCALGKQDFSVIGGHLKEAEVHPTLEVWLQPEQTTVRRGPDEESGLNLLQLPDAFQGKPRP